uniref:(northern house mosquito) hypothetical protein n=1 Tax=Culex pipiens TaxID=7175 RepID=A0A8D8C454_CULPI
MQLSRSKQACGTAATISFQFIVGVLLLFFIVFVPEGRDASSARSRTLVVVVLKFLQQSKLSMPGTPKSHATSAATASSGAATPATVPAASSDEKRLLQMSTDQVLLRVGWFKLIFVEAQLLQQYDPQQQQPERDDLSLVQVQPIHSAASGNVPKPAAAL